MIHAKRARRSAGGASESRDECGGGEPQGERFQRRPTRCYDCFMRGAPDLIVTPRGGSPVLLAVETKVYRPQGEALEVAEAQLKYYMVGHRCHTGLLVTPETLWIYRDTFRDRSPDSIQRVGEFAMADVPMIAHFAEQTPPPPERAFEAVVQRWLEELVREAATVHLPSPLREAVEDHVVPALLDGEVRAAGISFERTGSN